MGYGGRVSELQALSVHRDCCRFSPDGLSVVLRPNPAFPVQGFFPSFHLSQSVELRSLPSSGGDGETEQRQSVLCPVRALTEYIWRTQAARKTDQLFTVRLGRGYDSAGICAFGGTRPIQGPGMGFVARSLSSYHMCRSHIVISVHLFKVLSPKRGQPALPFGERVLGGAC
ncbi:hypothetical protein N1851_034107 [Merluccius polli]|uniref:Uncharacterized protein n=1 Tax=Merluccius polli TaxID=89951 RepID=A0AA47M036_MERPO|nr:hypothetical protein N1851_034107 [Merluccius polli]